MRQAIGFLACSVILISLAHGQDAAQHYVGGVGWVASQDLPEWKSRTQRQFTRPERFKAITALEFIASDKINFDEFHHQRDKGVSWVATEVVPTLVELLYDNDPEVRGRAGLALNRFQDSAKTNKTVIPRLIDLFQDSDDQVRRTAVGFFVFLGSAAEPAVPDLVKVLKQERLPDVRYKAACALRTTGLKAQRILMEMLDEKSVEVRRAAVKALTFEYMNTVPQEELQKSAPKLKELLHDDDAEVRRVAAEALRFQSPRATETVSALTELLRDKDKKARHAAAINLLELGEASKPALPDILKLMDDDDKLFRRSLAIDLPRVGPEAIPALGKLLEDKDANVRAYAADGLGKFGPAAKEAAPALKRLLADMDDVFELQGRVCNHAGIALARILGDKKYLDGLPPMPEDGK